MIGRPSMFRRLYVGAMLGFALLLVAQLLHAHRQLFGGEGSLVAEDLELSARAFAELLSASDLAPETLAQQAQRLAALRLSMGPQPSRADEFLYSLWARDGRLLLHSPGAAPLVAPAPGRLLELKLGERNWRVYARHSADGSLLAVVAQAEGLYERQALATLADAGRLSVLAALLLALWVGLSTHAGLKPLREAAQRLQRRDPRDLGPLALDARHRELAPLVDAIDGLFARIARMLQAERSFFADAAHELRTPLAVVGTQAHVLAHCDSEAERLAALEPLEQGVARAGALLTRLLLLSRLEAQGLTASDATDLAALARQALTGLAARAQARGIELDYEGAPQAPCAIDPEAAASLLDNLLDNALRHSPDGGRIALRLALMSDAQGRGWLRLEVVDGGPGLPIAERERVFDRFYRAPGAVGEGSGLGLAIVRRIVELQGGSVRIEDTPGGGATVVVDLPQLSRT